jgi:hypothetical protein
VSWRPQISPPGPRARVAATCAGLALLAVGLNAPSAQADFGFLPGAEGFSVSATKLDGTLATQAGTHPYELSVDVNLNQIASSPGQPGVPFPDGDLKDLKLELPEGLIGNPTVIGQCTLAQFTTPRSSPFEAARSGESCPDKSQVGVVTLHSSLGARSFGLFNLTPPPGTAAELGFAPYGEPVDFIAHVRSEAGEYGLTMQASGFPQTLPIDGAEVSVWGTPWAVSHNPERGNCLNEEDPAEPWGKCSVGPPKTNRPEAFLTLPASCAAPLTYTATAASWQGAGSTSAEAQAPALEGCDRIAFQTISQAQPTSLRASSPTGFEFNLEVRQDGLLEPGGRQPSQVRDATVALPEGMTINPSVGAGLGVCTPAQLAAETATSAPGAACPNESKIGDFRAESPLLEEAINGGIFLAQPFHNPFGSLIAVYLIAKAPARGILVKVPGELVPDPATGRITAHFQELPQLPYSHLRLFFREGQRAPLASPAACGAHPVAIELTPWLGSAATLHHDSEFTVNAGAGGGACPGAGPPPFSPGAADGSVNANAGSYALYYLRLTRTDTEREITSYSATLPPGLTGRLAGIPYCSDAAIAAAKARSGLEELEAPSCPAASEIGHTVAGYGLGGVLDYAPGRLYLAGPYRGAPLSIVAVDSTLVGPFDLGVIVVRSAIRIDPQTAQVSIDTAGENPFPHIRDGIPLHLRDVRVYISRPNFTLNPTSCDPFRAISTLSGSAPPFSGADAAASPANLYQATNCSALRFAPKLKLKLRGASRRGGFPALRATATERTGDADIGRAIVALPPTEYLAQGHIREICALRFFEVGACPPSSVYGHARAFTPLLADPLEGPVYLRSSVNGKGLPDLVAALRGDGGIAIDLLGRIDSFHEGMRASFEVLPDAPTSKFVLTLQGGSKGLLENSADLCATPAFATGELVGQSNQVEPLKVKVGTDCHKHPKHNHKGGGRKRR